MGREALETRRVRYRPATRICLFMLIIGYGIFRTAVRWDLFLRVALNWTAPVLESVHHSATVGSRVAGPDVIITPELSDITRRLMRQSNVAGLSLGITSLHDARHNDEFGSWGIMSEEGENVTADTLFNIGSCSKAVLAYSMGILMEDFRSGRNRTSLPPGVSELTWNTKVGDLLPGADWKLSDEWATREANIGDALSHVTGVPRLAAGVELLHDFAWFGNDTTQDVVRRLRHLTMTHGLRMQWDYNNQMYILAAHIISQYAMMPYTAFATDRVFRPLEMSATTFSPTTAALTGNLSHAWSDAGRRLPYWLNADGMDNMEMLAGPGGVASSARDMTKWMREMLPWASSIRPERLPHPNPAYDATTARAIVFGRAPVPGISMIAYGLGWMRMTYHGHELVYHSGAVPGFRAFTILLPTEGAGVVSLANSDDPLAVHEITAFNAVHRIIGLPLLGSGQIQNATGFEILPDWIRHRLGAPGYLQVPQASSEISQVTVEQQLPLEMFVGTYSNVGYGNFTLCAPSTTSAYCKRVHVAFDSTHNASAAPALLAEWPRLLATHLRLEQPYPDRPNLLWMTTHFIFPEGYGNDRSPFDYELFPPGYGMYMECATRDFGAKLEVEGCGLFLTYERFEQRSSQAAVRGQAEVWFQKVQ
ncbi:beta-lactamase/transpeptidase-like protein [Trametes sanguinea]|nr:beta-lactamase/transpeptidase-like protein [Trametes sanguinea]